MQPDHIGDLFGIFQKLKARLPDLPIEGYYDAQMISFMRTRSWDQEWDARALLSHLPEHSEALVVDLGTGDGRLIKRLEDLGYGGSFIGVDNSNTARGEFFRRRQEHGFTGEFKHFDFLNETWDEPRADAAFFGSVSINGLTSLATVKQLFDQAENILKPGQPLVISCYTDSAHSNFLELDGVLDVEPYQDDDGNSRLMWRGLQFRGPYLTHNAYTSRTDEGGPGTLCVSVERIWTESEILAFADALSWERVSRTSSRVGDGGAEGWEVATLSFRK